jgi:thymidylate synthase (FAD)
VKIRVLDHGYVEFVEAWGHGSAMLAINEGDGWDNEVGIIEAARQSTQGSFRGWKEDEKLLATLFNHQSNQSTPFEAAGMTIEVQAPIMVFREWQRHRTQSYNEASARYKALPDFYYWPEAISTFERAKEAQNTTNKQAGGEATVLNAPEVVSWLKQVSEFYQFAESLYQYGLKIGIPKELARITMPVGHYSRMRATANLRNWLAFLTLRLDEKAQWEIRQFAEAVAQIVQHHFPHTWKLFVASFNSRR